MKQKARKGINFLSKYIQNKNYLSEWQREREITSIPQMPTTANWAVAGLRIQSGPLCEWQEPSYWINHYYLPGSVLAGDWSKELELEQNLGLGDTYLNH